MLATTAAFLSAALSFAAQPSVTSAKAAAPALAPAVSTPTPSLGVPAAAADPFIPGTYFGARYYRSNIGRFTTTDPVYTWIENLLDPQRWNRYAYVRNNPLRYVDPDGRQMAPGQVYVIGQGWTIRSTLDPANQPTSEMAMQFTGVTLGTGAFAAAIPALTALGVEASIAGGGSLITRAEQIHEAVGGAVTQSKTTVAVAQVGAGRTLVASSETALRPAQRALLKVGETAVTGPGHAEVPALNAAKAAGQTVTEVAASRPICANCATAIREAGAKIGSALKDKQN